MERKKTEKKNGRSCALSIENLDRRLLTKFKEFTKHSHILFITQQKNKLRGEMSETENA